MGKLEKIVFTLAVITAAAAQGEVPNTFTSGTTASASQVNANFSALDARVTSLEGGDYPAGTPSITITPNPQPLGTQVTVGGVTYTITRFKLPAFATNTSVTVDVPFGGSVTYMEANHFSANFRMNYASFRTTISGRTFACNEPESYSIAGSGGNYSRKLYCVTRLDSETVLIYGYGFDGFSSSFSAAGSSPDYSATDPYTTIPAVSQRTANRDSLRTLLAYIQISP